MHRLWLDMTTVLKIKQGRRKLSSSRDAEGRIPANPASLYEIAKSWLPCLDNIFILVGYANIVALHNQNAQVC